MASEEGDDVMTQHMRSHYRVQDSSPAIGSRRGTYMENKKRTYLGEYRRNADLLERMPRHRKSVHGKPMKVKPIEVKQIE